MAVAMLNGVDIYYEVAGEGEALILTHGSWTDATGWTEGVARLRQRYRVVAWDRRGHSRSGDGTGAGSRAEDAADLAALIEHVSDKPVHVVGSSYGGNVSLTLLTMRPDLVATAAVHEPPLFGLLEGTSDPAPDSELAVVGDLIRSGANRAAAEYFVENVALGAGAWEQLPASFQAVWTANAPTYLDELEDETGLSLDSAALAAANVPVLLTHGTDSPGPFRAVIARLQSLLPDPHVKVLEGAGHVPHLTHPDQWAASLASFHDGTVTAGQHLDAQSP